MRMIIEKIGMKWYGIRNRARKSRRKKGTTRETEK